MRDRRTTKPRGPYWSPEFLAPVVVGATVTLAGHFALHPDSLLALLLWAFLP